MYVAPEVFDNLNKIKSGKATDQIDMQKADAFALGMSILRAGNMDSLEDCYDKKEGKFNHAALKKHYQKFNGLYSDNLLLVEAVEKLVEPEPSHRWNAQYLRSEFPPKEEIDQCFTDDDDDVAHLPLHS